MMTMAPGMEVASPSNPPPAGSSTSDPLSPHSNTRSPVNAASWYPPSGADPRYASSAAHVDHMMMPGGAPALHRGSPPPPGASGIDSQQHSAAAMAVDTSSAAFFSASAAEASRYYQMHQAYESAATQGIYVISP